MSIYLFNTCEFWIFEPLYFVKVTVKVTGSSKSWQDINDVMMLKLASVTVGRSHPTHTLHFWDQTEGVEGGEVRRYRSGAGWKGRLLGVTDGFIVFLKSDLCCCSVHVSQ